MENKYYLQYNQYLEDSELYLSNISMWELIFFKYIVDTFKIIFEKINNTRKYFFYIIQKYNSSDKILAVNLIKHFSYYKNIIEFDIEFEI